MSPRGADGVGPDTDETHLELPAPRAEPGGKTGDPSNGDPSNADRTEPPGQADPAVSEIAPAQDVPPPRSTEARERLADRPGPPSAPASGESRTGLILSTCQVAGLLAAAAVPAVPPGPQRQDLAAAATVMVLLPTAALFVVAAVRARPSRRKMLGWAGLALADLVAGVGLVAAALHPHAAGTTRLDTTTAVTWSAITCLAVWLLTSVGPRRRGRWYDGLAVAFGAAAVAVLVLAEVVGPRRTELVLIALAALVVVAVSLVAAARQPSARVQWIAAGAALVAAADLAVIRIHPSPAGPSLATGLVDLLRLSGFALGALAVISPAAAPTAPFERPARRPGRVARFCSRLGAADVLWLSAGCSVALVAAALLGKDIPRAAALLALAGCVLGLPRLGVAVRRRRDAAVPLTRPAPARTDDLTGLANRRAVSEALAADPAGPDADGRPGWTDRISLLLVDLDRFKDVNDAMGHEFGDRLLTEVGARIRGVLRPTQLLARLGGDEFAVVLPGVGPEPARRIARELRNGLKDPFVIDGNRLHVQASVGIASCRLPTDEPADLLRQADVAMYHAKASGGIAVYDPRRDEHGAHRLRRIDELRRALERGDLEVHVQPQVDLRQGDVVGAEALARWRHPQDGVLLPGSFLPLAAQTGLMGPVAALVLDRALAACATWWLRGHQVPVSVNLTPDDLRDPELPGVVLSALQRHLLPASALCVEITEEALLIDPAATAALLERWRAEGVTVAIDDYGTGYSSLAYLRELPVDEIKLDRVFATDLSRPTTATIVRHTVAMAHGLQLRVVAEGIEDAQTATALAELDCDIGQGLHFGAAMTAEDFLQLLRSGR